MCPVPDRPTYAESCPTRWRNGWLLVVRRSGPHQCAHHRCATARSGRGFQPALARISLACRSWSAAERTARARTGGVHPVQGIPVVVVVWVARAARKHHGGESQSLGVRISHFALEPLVGVVTGDHETSQTMSVVIAAEKAAATSRQSTVWTRLSAGSAVFAISRTAGDTAEDKPARRRRSASESRSRSPELFARPWVDR